MDKKENELKMRLFGLKKRLWQV